jgi:AcrR family transcriptional regulator
MGLRERQKEKRYQAIINAALSLIQEKGYAATSIEEIAASAEVAVGTVYNYFHTKADIIVEIYKSNITSNLSRGQDLIASFSGDYRQLVAGLLIVYAAGYCGGREKSLLREIYSVVMSEQALARQELLQSDYLLVEQLTGLLSQLQQQNQLKPHIDLNEAAYILFSVANYDVMIFITDDNMQFCFLEENIKKHIQLVFEGLS